MKNDLSTNSQETAIENTRRRSSSEEPAEKKKKNENTPTCHTSSIREEDQRRGKTMAENVLLIHKDDSRHRHEDKVQPLRKPRVETA